MKSIVDKWWITQFASLLDQMWMLAGNCQGNFKTGQRALSTGNPINGVLADVCNAMGVPVTYFGDPGFGTPWVGLRA